MTAYRPELDGATVVHQLKLHFMKELRRKEWRVLCLQGMLFANAECCKTQMDVVRLFVHEATRVYRDKLVDIADVEMFDKLVREVIKKSFEDLNDADVMHQPLMYCHFALGIGDPKYMPITVYAELNKLLVDALDNHNEINMAMNLVLFEVRTVALLTLFTGA